VNCLLLLFLPLLSKLTEDLKDLEAFSLGLDPSLCGPAGLVFFPDNGSRCFFSPFPFPLSPTATRPLSTELLFLACVLFSVFSVSVFIFFYLLPKLCFPKPFTVLVIFDLPSIIRFSELLVRWKQLVLLTPQVRPSLFGQALLCAAFF